MLRLIAREPFISPDTEMIPSEANAATARAALYARYSSELQRKASIEDQLRMCQERAAKEGWLVAGSYTDQATRAPA